MPSSLSETRGTRRFWRILLRLAGEICFWASSFKISRCTSGERSWATEAPWLADPSVIAAPPGSRPEAVADEGVDVYAWAHNETSTAVMAPAHSIKAPTACAMLKLPVALAVASTAAPGVLHATMTGLRSHSEGFGVDWKRFC